MPRDTARGGRLRRELANLGLSKFSAAAAAIGTSEKSVTRWYNGAALSASMAIKTAKLLKDPAKIRRVFLGGGMSEDTNGHDTTRTPTDTDTDT
ncbi:MAG: hypothetical protein RPT25_09350, partial [Cycloclasticus sp.]